MKFIEIKKDIITINLDLKMLEHINFKKTRINYGDEAEYLKQKCLEGSGKAIRKVQDLIAKELCQKGINDYNKYFKEVGEEKCTNN